jgi:hypothetical protein
MVAQVAVTLYSHTSFALFESILSSLSFLLKIRVFICSLFTKYLHGFAFTISYLFAAFLYSAIHVVVAVVRFSALRSIRLLFIPGRFLVLISVKG